MALHLITGYAGTEHITSADQGAYNMGTFGEGEFVLDRGNKLGATVVTNNSITIADGEALMQGRFIKLPVGTTESVTIDNGTSGMKRKDLIVLRYTKDSGTGIESVALAVKKGTPDASSPADPSITTGTITDGTDLVNEMKLYRVNLDGLNITSIDTLFSVKTTMVEYMDEYQLPVADANTLGGVKKGVNVNIAEDGTISVPNAGNVTKGVVNQGYNVNISDGTLSVPYATYSVPGVMSVGKGLTLSDHQLKISGPYVTADEECNFDDGSSSVSVSATSDKEVRIKTRHGYWRDRVVVNANVRVFGVYGVIFCPFYFGVNDDGYVIIYGTLLNTKNTAQSVSKDALKAMINYLA